MALRLCNKKQLAELRPLLASVFLAAVIRCTEDTKIHQRRAMADLRTLGAAVEAYRDEHGEFPAAKNLNDLGKLLEPKYVQQIPRQDEWLNSYRYGCWRVDSSSVGCDRYAVISAGSDGRFENDDGRLYVRTQFEDPRRDIVYANGAFLQYPSFMQPSP